MTRANTAKTSGKPAAKASKTKVARSAQPAKPTRATQSTKPTKAAAPAKASKPAASKKATGPVDPSESIERSVREGATVTAHAADYASRALVASDEVELLLIARGEPPQFVLRETESRTGEEIFRVVAQLLIYDVHEGTRMVRDIKEQEVALGPPELLTDADRLAAFWLGTGRALAQILATRPAALDITLPYEMLPTRLLTRSTFRTAEQFEKAALGKSYLGRLHRELKTR